MSCFLASLFVSARYFSTVGLVMFGASLRPQSVHLRASGTRLYFLPHPVQRNSCLAYDLRFPAMSGTKCVVMTLRTVSFRSTARIMRAFLSCRSSLLSMEPSTEYALRDLEVVRVDVSCVKW